MEHKDWRVSDPLSEVTRRERRLLLGVSVLAFFMVKAGALPSKVSALGIELEHSDQKVLLLLLASIVVYLTVVFIVYAMSDFIVWRMAIIEHDIESQKSLFHELRQYPQDQYEAELENFRTELYQRNRSLFRMRSPISILRAFLEFVVPILAGSGAAIAVGLSAISST